MIESDELKEQHAFALAAEKPSTPKSTSTEGRDELNLAEFPLAALSNRPGDNQKTLEFRDTIFDKQVGELVERRLTVTAADKFGLPCAIDDEVILGLIQLSKRQGFTNRTVPFSRYEIIKTLGWEDESWNYHRILKALDRWTGVTLKYENAWWDPERKAWANETFHIIERLTEIKGEDGKERAAFVWSEVVFSNLQKGHLKTLDLDLYRRLKNPVSKRLYRLLDKRFYHRRKVQFDLVELAFHKLGIARTYKIGNIKQRIQPALDELESVGFIRPAQKGDRYEKHGVGAWNIIFEKGGRKDAESFQPQVLVRADGVSEVEVLLIEFGISEKKARRLASTLPEDFIRHKLEEVRFLVKEAKTPLANPAGYLVRAIEENYAPPKDFKSAVEKQKDLEILKAAEEIREQSRRAKAEQQRIKIEKAQLVAAEKRERIDAYLNSLSAGEKESVITEAIRREQSKGHGMFGRPEGKIAEVIKQVAIEEYVEWLLSTLPARRF